MGMSHHVSGWWNCSVGQEHFKRCQFWDSKALWLNVNNWSAPNDPRFRGKWSQH